MNNSEASLNLEQQPVLPFPSLANQNKSRSLALPIGTKIKSFEIDSSDLSGIKISDYEAVIKLANFASLDSLVPNYDNLQETESAIASFIFRGSLATLTRFWWHWFLSSSKQISLLVVLIVFQSSSQASNLLSRAKIYIDLDTQNVATLPENSQINLKNSQASPFNQAIRQSREIATHSPFYQQAQTDINRWSETIMDIARGRAEDGDLAGAISAANLIPQDNESTKLLAIQATQAMKEWQEKGEEQNLYGDYLVKAQGLIDPEQASSYSRAIGILRQIPQNAEEYSAAKNSISQWNQQIYTIARNRANVGDFKRAVEAAILISPNSVYHQLAKDEINLKIKSIYAQYME